jgi:hypothetical protein
MTIIDNITDQASQLTRVILEDGTLLSLTLTYHPTIQRWVIDVSHPDLTVSGINLTQNPNILREWRNLINFGLACIAQDGVDPFDVEDFANGRVQLLSLNQDDVTSIEEEVYGGVLQ